MSPADKGNGRVLLWETDYRLYITFYLHSVSNGTETKVLALYGTSASRRPVCLLRPLPRRQAPPAGGPAMPQVPATTVPTDKFHRVVVVAPAQAVTPLSLSAAQAPRDRPCTSSPTAPEGPQPAVLSSGRLSELGPSFLARFEKICKRYGLGPQNIINLSNQGRGYGFQGGAMGVLLAQHGPAQGARGSGGGGDPSKAHLSQLCLPRSVHQIQEVEETPAAASVRELCWECGRCGSGRLVGLWGHSSQHSPQGMCRLPEGRGRVGANLNPILHDCPGAAGTNGHTLSDSEQQF